MKTTMTAICTLLFALTALPANANPYSSYTCAQEGSGADNYNNDIYCQVITGPGSLSHKSIASAGVGACQSAQSGAPIECDAPASPGGGGAGAAAFSPNLSLGNEVYARIDTWVEYTGTCNEITTVCGFDVLLCNDRDLDSTCTNVGDSSDQLYSTQSNEPTIGGSCNTPDDGTKDDKNCDVSDLDARVGACMRESEVGTWAAGQIVVFIGAWVDSWPGLALGGQTNVGAGVSAGSYDVWLRTTQTIETPTDDPATTECVAPQCDDKVDNADTEDILIDYPADPGCDSPADTDETDSVAGTQPGSCLITRTLLTNPVDATLILDVHVFPCAPANCSVPPVIPAGTVDLTRTATCSAANACDTNPVTVVAVVVGGTQAKVTDACAGLANKVATATTAMPVDAQTGPKSGGGGHWTCVLETDATGTLGVYFGAGICLKPDNLA